MNTNAGRAALCALAIAASGHAGAASFATDDGWQINLDTTLSAGAVLRTSPREPRFIGLQNGGYALAPSQDNGTLNFGTGRIASAPFRATEEIQVKREDYGVFMRMVAYWDPVYDGTIPTDFAPLPHATTRYLGADIRLLDAYIFGTTTVDGEKLSWRIGNQAINLGESTFISGGINSFSPFDANALETPGAQLRDAVLPVPAIDVHAPLGAGFSLEAAYEFAWVRTRFEPEGSFFSTNDTLSDGATYIPIDPALPDSFAGQNRVNIPANDVFGGAIPRIVDRHPEDSGEFALALRYLAPFMNDTEFGLYIENYHSRTPFVTFTPGTLAGVRSDERLILGHPNSTYSDTANYQADYPHNIKLLGGSFSTTVLNGISLQGEISQRFNQPLLLNTLAGIEKIEGPFLCDFAQFLRGFGLLQQAALTQASCNASRATSIVPLTGGIAQFGTPFAVWKRYPITQAQATVTDVFGPIEQIGVSSWTLVAELGANHIENFPHDRTVFDTGTADARDGPGPAIISLSTATPKGLITQSAVGTVGEIIADMPDLLPHGIDLQPVIAFSYDIAGRNPTGAGLFHEGNAAISIGAGFTWLKNYKLDVQYTNHISIGPSTLNPLLDRDFASVALSVTF